MSEPATYHGWERVHGGGWCRVPNAVGTQGDVYAILTARAELTNHGERATEYLVLPAGKEPGWGDYAGKR